MRGPSLFFGNPNQDREGKNQEKTSVKAIQWAKYGLIQICKLQRIVSAWTLQEC